MALPVILVDSATGDDSQNSGAGPTTPVNGFSASYVTATVTLSGSPDLSNVATDGSHVLYLTTSTGVRFFKITAKNAGAFTVDVTPNPAGTASGLIWAIGGKRATIGSGTSVLLFDNGGSAGDAMPGWTIEMQSGHTETLSATIVWRRAGDATTGPIRLIGTHGAATKPILTWSNNGQGLNLALSFQQVRDFEIRNTNATKTASEAIRLGSGNTSGNTVRNITIAHATNKFWRGIVVTGFCGMIDSCTIAYTASYGIRFATGGTVPTNITYCEIHDTGADAIDISSAGDSLSSGRIMGNLIHHVTGIGMALKISNSNLSRLAIAANTVDNCSSDGIKLLGVNIGFEALTFENNILSNNGGYGLNFDTLTADAVRAYGVIVRNNDFYTNTSGKYNPSDLTSDDEQTLDPQFTSSSNYAIGINLKALGYPTAAVGV